MVQAPLLAGGALSDYEPVAIRASALRFKPSHVGDVLVFPPNIKPDFCKWLHDRAQGDGNEPVCFLMGPPGIGKRTLVYAAAADQNLDVIEPDALEFTEVVDAFARACMSSSLHASPRKRLWLCTGLDGFLQALESYDKTGAAGAVQNLQSMLKSGGRHLPPVVITMNAPCRLWRPGPELRVRVFKVLPANLTYTANLRDVQRGLRVILRTTHSSLDDTLLMRSFTGDWRQVLLGIAFGSAADMSKTDVALLDAFETARLLARIAHQSVGMDLMAAACVQLPLVMQLLHVNYVSQASDIAQISAAADAWSTCDVFVSRYTQPALQDNGYAQLIMTLHNTGAAGNIASTKFLDMPSADARSCTYLRQARYADLSDARNTDWAKTRPACVMTAQAFREARSFFE